MYLQKRLEELDEKLQKEKQINYKLRKSIVENEKRMHGLSNRIDELQKLLEENPGDN